MRRWLALAVVGLMLAVPAASAASWLEPGNGPERTGAIDFEGPQTNDTALQLELPGLPVGETVIVDDQAYMMTTTGTGLEGDAEDLTERALWRIDLDAGTRERVMDLPEDHYPVFPGEISPDRLLLQRQPEGELVAVEVPSGEEMWSVQPLPDSPREYRGFRGITMVDGTLFVGVYASGTPTDPVARFGSDIGSPDTAGVMAVDVETGEERWTWTRTVGGEQTRSMDVLGTRGAPDRRVRSMSLSADEHRVYPYMFLSEDPGDGGMAAGGEYAYVDTDRQTFEIRALDATHGDSLWARNDTEQRGGAAYTSAGAAGDAADGWGCCARPVVSESRVHVRLDAFEGINPQTGDAVWTSAAGQTDRLNSQGADGMGLRGNALVGTTEQTVYRLDAQTGDIKWQRTSGQEHILYASTPIAIDEETAYVETHHLPNETMGVGIEATDLETGEVEWKFKYMPDTHYSPNNFVPNFPAFTDGAMVWGAKDGTVHVVGETEASLGEPDVDSAKYPDEGEQVAIDAAGAEPGAMGPATRYMVDWGDGSISGWQESPTFTHTYNESGEYQAQVYAGNDANQTASTVATMNVGGSEPNLAETAFARENQDLTFGLLGLAVALGGGAIGATKRYRKRSRLEEELETLETGYEDSRGRPGECEAFLETRRARARSLVLDGVLTEEQGTIIQDRADELRRELRTQALEDEFGFLPYSLVTKARQMLEDGRVTALEVEAFESALDEVEGLSEEQRTVVRERIESWEARDEGGA